MRASRERLFLPAALRSLFAAAILLGTAAAARAANVEGTVRDPGGNPVAGATVAIGLPFFPFPETTTTDANGHYKFEFISSGCYEIRAESATYGIVLYGDTIVSIEQRRVEVGTQNLTGIDLNFLTSRSLGGTVSFIGATPPSDILVDVLDPDGNPTAVEKRSFQGPPGQYAYTFMVPEGDWLLRARDGVVVSFDTYYPGEYSLGDAGKVTVAASDVTGIDFPMPQRPVLNIHVRDSGGAGVPALLKVFAAGSTGEIVQGETSFDGDTTEALPLPPGTDVFVNAYPEFELAPFANPDGTVASWSTPITLSGGTDEVTLHKVTPPSFEGRITEVGTGNPINAGTVTLTPAVPIVTPGAHGPSTARTFSGDFQFSSVLEGWYTVSARGHPALLTDFHVPTKTPGLILIDSQVTGFNLALPVGGRVEVSASPPAFIARTDLYDSTCRLVDSVAGSRSNNVLPGNYKVFVQPLSDINSLTGVWASGDSCPASPIVAGVRRPSVTTVTAGQTTQVAVQFNERAVQRVSGDVTDQNGAQVQLPTVRFTRVSDGEEFLARVDECGQYSVFLPAGTYDVTVVAAGYSSFTGTQIVASAPVVRDFTLQIGDLLLEGFIATPTASPATTRMPVGVKPVQQVLIEIRKIEGVDHALPGRELVTDLRGYLRALHLLEGDYEITGKTRDKFDPIRFVFRMSNGLKIDRLMLVVRPDIIDPLDQNRPARLRPLLEATFAKLIPNVAVQRSFANSEDIDWFRFDGTAGKYYQTTLTETLASISPINQALFVGTTKAPVESGGEQLFSGTGWQAPSTGEYWVALSSGFSGNYTVSLTESDTPPIPTPTVTGINPTSGPAAGGTDVTITGADFAANATVKIGGVNATSVVRVNSTTITCRTPALPAGTLNDVVVDNPASAVILGGISPRAPSVSGTLVKGWLADFLDVPPAFLYHNAIEKIFRAGITTGCGAGNYCPLLPITRDAMAAFILRGEHGGSYVAPDPTGDFFEDVETTTFLARWMEQFGREGISTGCGMAPSGKPNYCPTGLVTRDGMAVFLERGKNGASFNPPNATGTVFCDVLATTFLAKWMEQLKADNITQGCGAGSCGKPNYCPTGTVTRGEMAPFIVRAFGL